MKEPLLAFVSKYLELTEEEVDAVLALDLVRGYQKGDVIAEQGEVSDQSYFVLEGIIRCHRLVDGMDKTIDFFTEGEVFEPHSVADKTPLTYSISCVEDSTLSVSTPDLEQEMEGRFPRFEKVCRLVAEEAVHKNWRSLQEFKLSTPQERYERLCDTRPDLVQRVPQYMIAGYLGIEPESLSRIRGRMARS